MKTQKKVACVVILLVGAALVSVAARAGELDPEFIRRMKPVDSTLLSGLWVFKDQYSAHANDVLKLFRIHDELYGVLEGKDATFVLRGKTKGKTVEFIFGPMTISGLNPTQPMTDDQKRFILSRATTKASFKHFWRDDALRMHGTTIPWTYNPSTKKISHGLDYDRVLIQTHDFRKPVPNLNGRWYFSPTTYMILWSRLGIVRGEMNYQGGVRIIVGYVECKETNEITYPFSPCSLVLYEFMKNANSYKAPDPNTHKLLVIKHEYKISADYTFLKGRRALMDVGHDTTTKRLTHIKFHKWQDLIVKEKDAFLPLKTIAILPLKKEYEVNYRTGFKTKFEGLEGTLQIRGRLYPSLKDDEKQQLTKVRVYSNRDPKGIWVELKEPTKDSKELWSLRAVQVGTKKKSGVLRVEYGDRVFVTQDVEDEKSVSHKDFAWFSGGGSQSYGPAITPAWRIPQSKDEYDEIADNYTMLFSADDVLQDPATWANDRHKRMLLNPKHLTAEEVLYKYWSNIKDATKAEGIPAPLLGAILLQNMRSMNFFDIRLEGKSIGISQTPYYMAQKVARLHGIKTLGIQKGTSISEDRAKKMLYNAYKSVYIAAAHIRVLADTAITVLRNKGRDYRYFNYRYFRGKESVDEKMRGIAGVIGYNVDQWQMNGTPETVSPSGEGYELGIVVALEDIYRHLDNKGDLNSSITKTPRNYVEAVLSGGAMIEPSDANKPYRWFKAGDVIPNFYPSKVGVQKSVPSAIESEEPADTTPPKPPTGLRIE